MTFTDLALIVIAASAAIFVLTLIPTLQAIKKSAISAAQLADMVNLELKPTIQELAAVLVELKTVSKVVAENAEDVKCFMSAVGETGNNLHSINRTIGTVSSALSSANVFAAGVKAAGQYLLQSYLIKRGGK